MATRTMIFGDNGSVSADLAWLWINSQSWPAWRVEVITANLPDLVEVTAHRPDARPWSPPHPRIAFANAHLDEVVHLTIDMDPRLALSIPADLLVVGPRGPGLVKAMHLGSTVEWLMARPPAPMLIARHGWRTRSATVCHDGSPHAQAATEALSRMPWVGDLRVAVVSVDDGRTDVEHAVESATKTLETAGAEVSSQIVRNGEPTLDVLRYLEHHDSDLLVLGTQGLTGVRRLRIGSTAGVLAHATKQSVLLVCADEVVVGSEHH
jgi:nucleotide-binding universal stress UspA family protein